MTANYWKKWVKASCIRSLKTMAQTAVGMLTGNLVGVLEVDWIGVASVAAMAGIVSMLTSVAGLPEVKLEGVE
jgi:spore maturation protein SpmA